jgi:hypothetical protein
MVLIYIILATLVAYNGSGGRMVVDIGDKRLLQPSITPLAWRTRKQTHEEVVMDTSEEAGLDSSSEYYYAVKT